MRMKINFNAGLIFDNSGISFLTSSILPNLFIACLFRYSFKIHKRMSSGNKSSRYKYSGLANLNNCMIIFYVRFFNSKFLKITSIRIRQNAIRAGLPNFSSFSLNCFTSILDFSSLSISA